MKNLAAPAVKRSSGFVSVTASMSVRKSSHGTIFLIVSSGSQEQCRPQAL
jgi:hypothetical protein